MPFHPKEKELVEKIHQFLTDRVETNQELSEAAKERLIVASECIEKAYGIERGSASSELLDLYINSNELASGDSINIDQQVPINLTQPNHIPMDADEYWPATDLIPPPPPPTDSTPNNLTNSTPPPELEGSQREICITTSRRIASRMNPTLMTKYIDYVANKFPSNQPGSVKYLEATTYPDIRTLNTEPLTATDYLLRDATLEEIDAFIAKINKPISFHCKLNIPKIGYSFHWVELAAIPQLKPDWIFIDLIRSIYLFHNYRFSNMLNKAEEMDRINGNTLLQVTLNTCVNEDLKGLRARGLQHVEISKKKVYPRLKWQYPAEDKSNETQLVLEPIRLRDIPGGTDSTPPDMTRVDFNLRISKIYGIKSKRRIMLYCAVENNSDFIWIDLEHAAKLEPRAKLIDYIRGLYFYDLTIYNSILIKAQEQDEKYSNNKLVKILNRIITPAVKNYRLNEKRRAHTDRSKEYRALRSQSVM